MRVLSVVGTRPEVIKMAPVIISLQNNSRFTSLVCSTSQHCEMQNQMFSSFGINSDIDLSVMKPGQDLFYVTSEVISKMKDVISELKPDLILTHGDTTTCLSASIAAFYSQVPVGHVEAGLRTYNSHSPFPEEMNRQLVSRLATLHFAPTYSSRNNLLRENIDSDKIFVTGNTVIDALLMTVKKNEERNFSGLVPEYILKLIKDNHPFVLITGHRRENIGESFINICKAIRELSFKHKNVSFIYPVHLNPAVRKTVYKWLCGIKNLYLIEPLSYESFVYLLSFCKLVLTDSGGIQEEAPSLGKPVLIMRDVTERMEGIESGTTKLVGTKAKKIFSEVSLLLSNDNVYQKMSNTINPYGDGTASSKIIDILIDLFLATRKVQ